MLKFTAAPFVAFIGMICLAHPLTRTEDARLARSQMLELFGGNIGVTGTCCLAIAACNVATVSCADFTTMTTCTSGNQVSIATKYSKSCKLPTPQCNTCNCADFQNDANGKQYDCVTYYSCTWDPVRTSCGQTSPLTQTGQVQGYFSCADNCP